MTIDDRFYRPIGFISIFASLPMLEAGVEAASGFIGDTPRLLMSVVSTAGAFLLLVAGIVLCAKRPAGRTIAYCAATISIPVTFMGAVIGLMGAHALMYGLGYPIAIVTLLRRATPSGGAPASTQPPEPESTRSLDRHARAAIT